MKGRKWDNCNSIINKYIKKGKNNKLLKGKKKSLRPRGPNEGKVKKRQIVKEIDQISMRKTITLLQ